LYLVITRQSRVNQYGCCKEEVRFAYFVASTANKICPEKPKSIIFQINFYRKNFGDIVEFLLYDSDSSDDEDDLFDDYDLILYEMAFTQKPMLGPRLNLQDVSEDDCEKMFRYTLYMFRC
jgi:hypothetical protein